MAPYGQAARMGDTVNPALFNPDFSGYANAGMIAGQAMSNLGADIGGVIKERKNFKKKLANDEKFITQALEMFRGTDMEAPISATLEQYTSEDITDREKDAIGTSIRETIQMGMAAQDLKMQQAKLAAMQGGGDSFVSLTPEQVDAIQKQGGILDGQWQPDGTFLQKETKMGRQGLSPMEQFAMALSGGKAQTISPAQGAGGTSIGDVFGRGASGISAAAGGYSGQPIGSAADGSPGVLPSRGYEPVQLPTQEKPPTQEPLEGIPDAIRRTSQAELAAIPGMVQKEIPVVDDQGVFTGKVEAAPGSMLEKDMTLKELTADEKRLQIAKMEKELGSEDKEAIRAAYAEQYKDNQVYVATRDIDQALKLVDGLKDGVVGTNLRIGKGAIPGTDEYVLENSFLAPLRNNIAFSQLKLMRQTSPTGGAVGQLSDDERKALAQAQGALMLSTDKATLKRNLQDLRKHYANIAFGSKKERDLALKEGKITKSQYDANTELWKSMAEGKKPAPKLSAPSGFDPELDKILNELQIGQ